ncbi:MAG: DegT/DnrJ/EryC1/StrS family aminotransferase [Gaiellaceae bacterium]
MSAPRRISLFRPVLAEDAASAVKEVLESGWLGLGPKTSEFERAFAAFVGAPHCVATNCCSAALQLALHVLDLPAGAEVVTTPLTFVASNQLILHEGLRPVFADVDPTTGNLDAASVAARISERTGVLLLLHYGGNPCDLDELYTLARAHDLPVIEDCAHACGASYRGRRIGSHGDLHAFSFHAVKNLTTGEGGAVTVRSQALESRLRKLRWFGIDSDTHARAGRSGYRWDYDVTELGFKHHMSDINAAIGLVQLPHLVRENARRAELVARYRAGLAGIPGIELLREQDDRESSHHLFCVLADDRDALVDALSAEGIDAGVHYRPSYDYALFGGEPLPGVESFWRRTISLPLHLWLGEEDVDRIVSVISGGW